MAKVSSETTDHTKKAPRKRAVRRVVSNGETATRKRVGERNSVSQLDSTRKAPTRLSETSDRSPSIKNYAVVFGICAVIFFSAAWIGFSDQGQIDVNASINQAANRTANNETDLGTTENGGNSNLEIPVQNTPPAAISGLRGRGVGTSVATTNPNPEEEINANPTTTEEIGEEDASNGEPAPADAETVEPSVVE